MKQLKPRDKITQKMTRDGAVEINETQQTAERISSREADSDFSQPDTATAERVMEHLDAAHTRKASKKAVKKAQEAAVLRTSTSRLQFTDEERETPKLQPYIKKSEKAADKLDAAKAALPKQKKLVKERTFEETAGKAKTRLRFEEQEKPIPGGKAHSNPLSHPAQEAGIFVHNKIHSVEKDNSGVEGAHKSEELAERGARYGTRKLKQGYRSHKLKPYREAAKAEQAAFKANVNFQYHKALQENPQLTSNPFSRFMQKQKIKRQYAKTVKKSGAATAKAAAGASQTAAKKAAAFAGRHPAGVIIAIAALLLFIMVSVGLSSCGAMFSGSMNSVLGTSYTSEDSDLVATEQSYAAMENELQQEIDNIESTHSGYDEYRYDLDTIGHNPHELASYLTALLQSYTPQSAQAELKRLFGLQYTLTLTEEIEIRTTTDEEGNEEEYEYRILNVKLTNKPIASLAEELLNPQQFEMFKVYRRLSALVSDILDLSKLESGVQKMDWQPVALTQSIRGILTRYGCLVGQDGYQIHLDTQEEVWVEGDAVRLEQVLYNLVNNAIHYTGPDKSITITQTVADGWVTVTVADTGEGIAPEQLPLIWDRYYKIDKNHRQTAVGSGLGLSIVKGVLEQHHARYGVDSVVGEGSRFWFALPVLSQEEPPALEGSQGPNPQAG